MNELECSAGGRAGERENTCSVIPFIDKQHQQRQQQQHHHPYRSKEWRVSERNILYTGRLVGSLASRLHGAYIHLYLGCCLLASSHIVSVSSVQSACAGRRVKSFESFCALRSDFHFVWI